jgi:hypothetical protein
MEVEREKPPVFHLHQTLPFCHRSQKCHHSLKMPFDFSSSEGRASDDNNRSAKGLNHANTVQARGTKGGDGRSTAQKLDHLVQAGTTEETGLLQGCPTQNGEEICWLLPSSCPVTSINVSHTQKPESKGAQAGWKRASMICEGSSIY